jgi:short subunit dehydrogenase-like uncharacterized protein
MDWLIDQNIPFTAVGRSAARIRENMAQRVVRLESAVYEIIETPHEVDALIKVFKGAKVVCNTVGPFVTFGAVAVEASLKAGCHYLDTTGEQGFTRAMRDEFGALFRQAGLVLSPSLSYMYALSEIAAELALETPGIDMLETASLSRGPMQGSGVSVGSTASILELFRTPQQYLWDNKMIDHPVNASYEVSAPEFLTPVFCLPWGGTSLPVIYERDPRVRFCRSLVGFYDNQAMRMVHGLGQKWDAEYKGLPREQQDGVLNAVLASMTPSMPPRERNTLNRSVDFAIGRGQLSTVRATVNSVAPYITTGALQTAGVMKLLDGEVARPGFASGCQAFGHRYLLSFLEQRGLARAHVTVNC